MLVLDRLALLIAVVGLAVVAGCLGRTGAHAADQTRLRMEQAEVALLQFRLHNDRFPNEHEGLAAVVDDALRVDVWGRPLVYRASTDGYEIVSLGADGRVGGDGLAADLSTADE